METETSKVLRQFLLIFMQSGDVLFYLHARRLRGYTATATYELFQEKNTLFSRNLTFYNNDKLTNSSKRKVIELLWASVHRQSEPETNFILVLVSCFYFLELFNLLNSWILFLHFDNSIHFFSTTFQWTHRNLVRNSSKSHIFTYYQKIVPGESFWES